MCYLQRQLDWARQLTTLSSPLQHTVFVEGIPALSVRRHNEVKACSAAADHLTARLHVTHTMFPYKQARRFVTLVDELYENGASLVGIAATPLQSLFGDLLATAAAVEGQPVAPSLSALSEAVAIQELAFASARAHSRLVEVSTGGATPGSLVAALTVCVRYRWVARTMSNDGPSLALLRTDSCVRVCTIVLKSPFTQLAQCGVWATVMPHHLAPACQTRGLHQTRSQQQHRCHAAFEQPQPPNRHGQPPRPALLAKSPALLHTCERERGAHETLECETLAECHNSHAQLYALEGFIHDEHGGGEGNDEEPVAETQGLSLEDGLQWRQVHHGDLAEQAAATSVEEEAVGEETNLGDGLGGGAAGEGGEHVKHHKGGEGHGRVAS